MFYSVGFAQILCFCNASCGSAENMVVVMMVMVVVVVVMMVMVMVVVGVMVMVMVMMVVVMMVVVMMVVVVMVMVMMVVVMMVMVMMVVIMTMMINRRRRDELRTAPFETVHKTPQFLLYSSISVHRHTVNSSFRMPNSTLKVLSRNLPACRSICEEQQ
jgi:hypothetical protein